MLPIKSHQTKIYEHEGYNLDTEIKPECNIEYKIDGGFSFQYCVSYRHPSEPEWILARGYWNDEGIWTPDGIWWDQ